MHRQHRVTNPNKANSKRISSTQTSAEYLRGALDCSVKFGCCNINKRLGKFLLENAPLAYGQKYPLDREKLSTPYDKFQQIITSVNVFICLSYFLDVRMCNSARFIFINETNTRYFLIIFFKYGCIPNVLMRPTIATCELCGKKKKKAVVLHLQNA